MSPELWQAVQDRIDANRHGTRRKSVEAPVNPLSGKLADETGERLVASHAQKKGRKYRYYISAFLIRRAPDETRRGWRIPAPALETLVLSSLERFLTSPAMLTDAWRNAGQPLTSLQPVIAALQHKRNGQDARHGYGLIQRIVLSPAEISLHIDLASLVPGTPVIIQEVPVTMAQRGIEMRLVHESGDHTPVNVDATLIKAIARGHRWFQQMRTDGIGPEELARTEGVSARYIVRLVRLAFLSPALVSKIAEGRQPVWLNAQTLANNITIEHGWDVQASQLLSAKAA